MFPSLAIGQYPVAIHRWFARGEEWAVHPQLAPQLPQIVRLLDARLKSRQLGTFRLSLASGEILGEMHEDTHCLDSRAQARRPLIIRLVQLPGQGGPLPQELFLEALRKVPLPQTPGLDPGLIVRCELPLDPKFCLQRRPDATAASERRPRGRYWLVGGLALGLLAVGGALLLWSRRDQTLPPSENSAPPTPEVVAPVSSPEMRMALLRRYEAVDHPYIHFLLHHPEALSRSRQADEPSYDAWRATQSRSFTAAQHPLPRQIRERVALWRVLPADFQAACQRLGELRRELAPGATPCRTAIEEIEAFFETLTRPGGLPPREEFDHPANAFLARLPRDPFEAGQTYDDLEQVQDSLRRFLNEHLKCWPPVPQGTRTAGLLNRLREELDYARWREREKRLGVVFAEENTVMEESLRQAIRRFQPRK